jgi:hypothetical protein
MSESSERNDGMDFENAVADALSLAGWRVEREQVIGHKKVDIVAREVRWGAEWVTLVECKDHINKLTRDAVIKIWADYQPLINQGLAQELLIVSSHGLAPSAVTYVNNITQLQAQTLSEILTASIDFSGYVANLSNAFNESPDGISAYYVPPRITSGGDLKEFVMSWINGNPDPEAPPSGRPIAILGAYGIGKSSFATHLTSELAAASLENPQARVPIMIRLGDIAGEQSLEGLLGKHFTATYNVPGYSFNSFMALNKAGRFVIILDAFDEMKQLLSWREFRYNLKQLNRLQADSARLIILGRPTAFETDEQRQAALHGQWVSRVGIREDPSWPNYFEIELAQLGEPEVRLFLERYLKYRSAQEGGVEEAVPELWSQVSSRQLRDIARRPVQLRMLAEILPTYSGQIDELGLATLYDIFITHLIDEVIKREEDKQARLAFTTQDRRHFLTDLAFWLWANQSLAVLEEEMIPDNIVAPYVRGEDPESVRRDLVVGSPLDRRAGDRLRFPHRSFQEFLVAEAMWAKLDAGSCTLADVTPLMNDEVANFMRLQRGRSQLATARRELGSLEGSQTWRTVIAVLLDKDLVESVHSRVHAVKPKDRSGSKYVKPRPWDLLLLAIWNMDRSRQDFPSEPEDWVATAKADGREDVVLLCLFCLLRLGAVHSWNVEGETAELLDLLITNRGEEVQRYSQLAAQGANLVPLKNKLIGRREMRMDRPTGRYEIGVQVGRGQLTVNSSGAASIIKASSLEVRWLGQAAVDISLRLQVMRGGRRFDLRSLRAVFAINLPRVAFVDDWVSDGTLANDIRLTDAIEFAQAQESLTARIAAIRNFVAPRAHVAQQ